MKTLTIISLSILLLTPLSVNSQITKDDSDYLNPAEKKGIISAVTTILQATMRNCLGSTLGSMEIKDPEFWVGNSNYSVSGTVKYYSEFKWNLRKFNAVINRADLTGAVIDINSHQTLDNDNCDWVKLK